MRPCLGGGVNIQPNIKYGKAVYQQPEILRSCLKLRNMKNHILYILIRVEVEGKTDLMETVTEFERETNYNFDSTENVKVLETELLATNFNHP